MMMQWINPRDARCIPCDADMMNVTPDNAHDADHGVTIIYNALHNPQSVESKRDNTSAYWPLHYGN